MLKVASEAIFWPQISAILSKQQRFNSYAPAAEKICAEIAS